MRELRYPTLARTSAEHAAFAAEIEDLAQAAREHGPTARLVLAARGRASPAGCATTSTRPTRRSRRFASAARGTASERAAARRRLSG